MIRRTWRKKLSNLFPRASKTDYSKDDWPYNQSEAPRTGSLLPFASRPDIYSNPNTIAHFGILSAEPRTLQLTTDTSEFIQRVTSASLSHLLIWYVYHDVVPVRNDPTSWYHVLNRAELVGWIRFGHELARGSIVHRVQQLPERLQAAILDLNLDERDVVRKLMRLGDMAAMRDHELAEFKLKHLNHVASYTGAGEKLEASLRLIRACRPISQTNWEDFRTKAISWIETFMEVVIRPAVDSSARAPSQWASNKATEKETRRAFELICGGHSEKPPQAIYRQAIDPFVYGHMTEPSVTHETITSHHEQSWFAGTGEPYHAQTAAGSSHDRAHRRRSAPMLDQQVNSLLNLQEEVDSLREKADALLQLRNSLSRSANTPPLQDRHTSRAFDRDQPIVHKGARHHVALESDGDYSQVADTSGSPMLHRYRPINRSDQLRMYKSQASRSTPDLANLGLSNDIGTQSDHEDHDEQSSHPGGAPQLPPEPAMHNGRATPVAGPSALRRPQNVDGNHIPGQVASDDVSSNTTRRRNVCNGPQSSRSGGCFTNQPRVSMSQMSQVSRPLPPQNGEIPKDRNDSASPGYFDDFDGAHHEPLPPRRQQKSVFFGEQVRPNNGMMVNGRLSGPPSRTLNVSEKSKATDCTEEESTSYTSEDEESIHQRVEPRQNGVVNGGHVDQDHDDEEDMTSLSSQDSLVAAAAVARRAGGEDL